MTEWVSIEYAKPIDGSLVLFCNANEADFETKIGYYGQPDTFCDYFHPNLQTYKGVITHWQYIPKSIAAEETTPLYVPVKSEFDEMLRQNAKYQSLICEINETVCTLVELLK